MFRTNLASEVSRATIAETANTALTMDVSTNLSTIAATVNSNNNSTVIADLSSNLASEITRATSVDGANAILIGDVSSNLASSIVTINNSISTKANLDSATLTGIPTAPTASSTTDNAQLATTAFVQTRIGEILDNAPVALDTLNELAAALGDDSNFSATISTQLGTLTTDLANETTRATTKERIN